MTPEKLRAKIRKIVEDDFEELLLCGELKCAVRTVKQASWLQNNEHDLREFLCRAFAERIKRQILYGEGIEQPSGLLGESPIRQVAATVEKLRLEIYLSRLEKLLRSQSGRDSLSKSLPGVEKTAIRSRANR